MYVLFTDLSTADKQIKIFTSAVDKQKSVPCHIEEKL